MRVHNRISDKQPGSVTETLESASTHRSQEIYLVPRNCWLHITTIKFNTEKIQKGQKLRIHISVPNSSRSVRSSPIAFDQELLSYLSEHRSENGFSELQMDITAVCEYRHDTRVGHPSNLEIEVEILTTAILTRYRKIGQVNIDVTSALQAPLQLDLPFQHDQKITGYITIEIHSLSIFRAIPSLSVQSSEVILSDSDSEPLPTVSEQTFKSIIQSHQIILVDVRISSGQKFAEYISTNESLLRVYDISAVNLFFTTISNLPPSEMPFKIITVGSDLFTVNVLTSFIFMRDRGLLLNDCFQFSFVPLESDSSFLQALSLSSPNYQKMFANQEWYEIFLQDSSIQNPTGIITANLQSIFSSKLNKTDFPIADIQVMTSTNQVLLPMLQNLQIISNQGPISMRASFIKSNEKSKTKVIKFNYFVCHLKESALFPDWKENGNLRLKKNPLKTNNFQKMTLTMVKQQKKIDIIIDGNEVKDVVGIALSIRDNSSSVSLWSC